MLLSGEVQEDNGGSSSCGSNTAAFIHVRARDGSHSTLVATTDHFLSLLMLQSGSPQRVPAVVEETF